MTIENQPLTKCLRNKSVLGGEKKFLYSRFLFSLVAIALLCQCKTCTRTV